MPLRREFPEAARLFAPGFQRLWESSLGRISHRLVGVTCEFTNCRSWTDAVSSHRHCYLQQGATKKVYIFDAVYVMVEMFAEDVEAKTATIKLPEGNLALPHRPSWRTGRRFWPDLFCLPWRFGRRRTRRSFFEEQPRPGKDRPNCPTGWWPDAFLGSNLTAKDIWDVSAYVREKLVQ